MLWYSECLRRPLPSLSWLPSFLLEEKQKTTIINGTFDLVCVGHRPRMDPVDPEEVALIRGPTSWSGAGTDNQKTKHRDNKRQKKQQTKKKKKKTQNVVMSTDGVTKKKAVVVVGAAGVQLQEVAFEEVMRHGDAPSVAAVFVACCDVLLLLLLRIALAGGL